MARLRRVVYTSLLFMVFVQIGDSIYFYFARPILPNLVEVSWKIEIPQAKSIEKLHGFRSTLIISIEDSGAVSFDGYQFERSKWKDVLQQRKIDPLHPVRHIVLLVDRNCSMSTVYEIFSELKEASLLNVFFAARPIPSRNKIQPVSNNAHATWFSVVVLTVLISILVFYAARRERNRRLAALNRIYKRAKAIIDLRSHA